MSSSPRRSPSARKGLTVITMREAIERLAVGTPTATVAKALGCSRAFLQRKLNLDHAFHLALDYARELYTGYTPDNLHWRRELARRMNELLSKPNERLVMWMAERLNVLPGSRPSRASDRQRRGAFSLADLSPEELAEFEALALGGAEEPSAIAHPQADRGVKAGPTAEADPEGTMAPDSEVDPDGEVAPDGKLAPGQASSRAGRRVNSAGK